MNAQNNNKYGTHKVQGDKATIFWCDKQDKRDLIKRNNLNGRERVRNKNHTGTYDCLVESTYEKRLTKEIGCFNCS